MCKSRSSCIFNSISLSLERRDCRRWSQTWQIILKRFRQNIKIGRYHLTAFRTILLFSETFTLSVCTKKQWKWKYSKHNVCREGLQFQWHIFPRKVPNVWRLERELQVERGIYWEKNNNWMTYLVKFITVFWPIIQPYLSRMPFLKDVTCWPVDDRGDKRDSEGYDICEHGIHIWHICFAGCSSNC